MFTGAVSPPYHVTIFLESSHQLLSQIRFILDDQILPCTVVGKTIICFQNLFSQIYTLLPLVGYKMWHNYCDCLCL